MFNSRFEWIPLYRASVFYKSTTTGNNCFVMILVCLLSVFVKWFETLLPFIKVQFIILFNTSNIQCMNEVGHAITNFIWLEKSHFKICSGRIKSGNKNFFYRSYTLQYNSLHRFPKKTRQRSRTLIPFTCFDWKCQ